MAARAGGCARSPGAVSARLHAARTDCARHDDLAFARAGLIARPAIRVYVVEYLVLSLALGVGGVGELSYLRRLC